MSRGCTGFLPQFLHHPGTPDFMKLTQTHLHRHTTQPALCREAQSSFQFFKSSSRLSPLYPGLHLAFLQDGWRMGFRVSSSQTPFYQHFIAYPSTVLLPLWWGQWWKVASSDLMVFSSKSLLRACIVSISSYIVILWNSKSTTSFSLFSLLYRHFWEAGRKREQLIRGGAKAYRKIWWRVNTW